MTTDKKRFLSLVTGEDKSVLRDVEKRISNRAMLKASKKIAINVLARLDEMGWTQKQLAEALGVQPQQVNKIVKGQQNLKLETIVRLQEVLGIPILAPDKAVEKKVQVVAFTLYDVEHYLPKIHPAKRVYGYTVVKSQKKISQTVTKHFSNSSHLN